MRRLLVVLFAALPSLGFAQNSVPDACTFPNPTIVDCPSRYYPLPVVPSETSKEAVDAKIREALAAKEAYQSAADEMLAHKAAQDDPQRSPEERESEASKYLATLSATNQKRARMYDAFNSAVKAAIESYHLTPPEPSLADDSRLDERFRRVAPWNPRFTDMVTSPRETRPI